MTTHDTQHDTQRKPERRPRRRDLRGHLEQLRPEHLLPEPMYTHLRTAGREELLAIRSLIDALIDRVDPTDDVKR